MPLPLLVAIVLAFGFGDRMTAGPIDPALLVGRLKLATGFTIGFAIVAHGLGAGFGWLIRRRKRRGDGGLGRAIRRGLRLTGLGLDLAALGGFAWLLDAMEWPRIVAWNLDLKDWVAVDEFVRIAPFLGLQMLAWSGIGLADRAVVGGRRPRWATWRKARVTFGLVLPMMLLYAAGRDLARLAWGDRSDDPISQSALMLGLGAVVLLAAPAILRLAWPTRPLPDGPIRDRLERLARRARFGYRDILIWGTGDSTLNAAVTGSLPSLRYVLLTDGLLRRLGPTGTEAVFGHEIGHAAHRHFLHFAAFLAGSLGVAFLVESLVVAAAGAWPGAWAVPRSVAGDPEAWQAGVALGFLGLYFFMVFGAISRRYERQADLYGCRAVSCGLADCDPMAHALRRSKLENVPAVPCPIGIRDFSDALEDVASWNGMTPTAWSWNHGRISDRLAFVRGLSGRPDRVGAFEAGLGRLRRRLAFALGIACLGAVGTWLASSPDRTEGSPPARVVPGSRSVPIRVGD